MTANPRKERQIAFQIAGFWLVLNLFQAAFTPLTEDEAYYWMYSTALDWGYFDHPPMIAVFILLGQWVGGELGVRLAVVIAQILTLLLLWKLVREQWPAPHRASVLFGIAFSLFLFQVFGFIATPDAPLLLFATIFLFLFRRFILQPKTGTALLLGVSAAAMLYSKYHGALLIMFSILANPGLLRRSSLYLAGLTAFLLFLPHLHWQYQHDFPSFRYHLMDRNQEFKAWYIFEFLLNIVLVFNPLLWVPTIRSAIRSSWKEPFTRTLLVIFAGFFAFFLFSTTRGHVQPQWLVINTLPFMLFLYAYSYQQPERIQYLWRVTLVVIPLALAARIAMATEWAPLPNQFFHPREFAAKVQAIAQGRAVAFTRSYQRASLYGFYTQSSEVFSAGTYKSRRSQFDLWNKEEPMHLKPVVWFGGQHPFDSKSLKHGRDQIPWMEIDTFHAIYKIRAVASPLPAILKKGEGVNVSLELYNPYPFSHDLSKIKGAKLVACWMTGKKPAAFTDLKCILPVLNPGERKIISCSFVPPDFLNERTYRIGFSFVYHNLQPFPTGNWQEVTIKKL